MDKEDTSSTKTVVVAVLVILGLQVVVGLAVYFSFSDWNQRGTFGDMFGSVNALFSGLALAGVIYAILLQRSELSLQRQELELTRKELERSAEAQESSARILREQLKLQEEQKVRDEQRILDEAAPKLIFNGGSHTGSKAEFKLENYGAPIYDLELHRMEGPLRVTINRMDYLVPGEQKNVVVLFDDGPADGYFGLSFRDGLNNRRSVVLFYNKADSSIREMPRLPDDVDLVRDQDR